MVVVSWRVKMGGGLWMAGRAVDGTCLHIVMDKGSGGVFGFALGDGGFGSGIRLHGLCD